MPSATETAKRRGGGSGANLLHGSDLPEKQRSIEVRISGAREAPANFNSCLILDIEEVLDGRGAFPLNQTNTKTLSDMLGDNYDEWGGSLVTLTKVAQRNPQTGEQTWGLAVTDAKPYRSSKKKPAPKGKSKAAKGKADKAKVGSVKDEDIPF